MDATLGAHLCYFDGEYKPLADAHLSIMTHAFNYGTAIFEGIRGYWNAEQEQLYLFRLREHFERLVLNTRIMTFQHPFTVDQLCEIAAELVRRNDYHENVYMRPTFYISAEVVGVRLHDLAVGLSMYAIPFGAYIDNERGLRCMVSSWKRNDDNTIPARSKIAGAYVNSAFAKSEAMMNGYDEGIMLSQDGHVSEGSAENIFLVMNGKLVTPPKSDNILVGVTRDTLMTLARDEMGMEIEEREIDRTELYVADEILLCGTGAQVAGVSEVDHRAIGSGELGPVTRQIQSLYFDAVYGRLPKYRDWCAPVYKAVPATA